jgi:transcriptional regulator with XRE-family HTH domain
MNATFGERLRAQRERQQISLTTIAEQTKIKLSLLEALEQDDASKWPRGIFGRSYLRSYAQAIGLDPDMTLRDFLASHSIPAEAGSGPLAHLREDTPDSSRRRPPTRLQVLIDSAIDAFHARRAEANARNGSSAAPKPAQPVHPVAPVTAYSYEAPQPRHGTPAIDLTALARVCTQLGRIMEPQELTDALQELAVVLDAAGVIIWVPDPQRFMLMPVFVHGYSSAAVSQLPPVFADEDNATAAAFQTHTTCVVDGNGIDNGAVAAPLLTPTGCTGVLALELRNKAERREDVRAAVTILAAQVSTLVGASLRVPQSMTA